MVKGIDMADTQASEAAVVPIMVEEMAEMPDGTAPMRVAMFDAEGNPVSPEGSGGSSITSAQATTLEAGQSATATIQGSVLKLGIPKGDKGDKGDAGAQGPAGKDATITKAAHVDPSSGTIADVVNALVAAGLMESA